MRPPASKLRPPKSHTQHVSFNFHTAALDQTVTDAIRILAEPWCDRLSLVSTPLHELQLLEILFPLSGWVIALFRLMKP